MCWAHVSLAVKIKINIPEIKIVESYHDVKKEYIIIPFDTFGKLAGSQLTNHIEAEDKLGSDVFDNGNPSLSSASQKKGCVNWSKWDKKKRRYKLCREFYEGKQYLCPKCQEAQKDEW